MSKIVGTVALALAAASVQAAPLPGFVLAAQTPRVSFYSRGQSVETQKVEKRVAELERLFGQSLGRRVSYYRYESAQEIAAGTGHYAAGVTFAAAGEVHSTQAFHDHELVHLVAGQLGDPGAFFQEGLAVAVANKGEWQGRSADRLARRESSVDVAALVASFDSFDPQVAYPVAGSFVAHLIRTQGIGQVTAYFRACRPGTDSLAQFARSFGQPLEAAAAAWRSAL
ncbi:MAG TPA: hypothetical protein VMR21_04875 [Vicinamibacteria bacterium]|nr:hypothetical protein [Vicinamibacteria bacterium]